MNKNILSLVFLLVLSILYSCTSDSKPDISSIEVDLEIIRLENEIFSLDSTNIIASIDDFYNKHTEVSDLYFEKVMNFLKRDRSGKLDYDFIKKFIGNEALLGLVDSVNTKFPSLGNIEEELEEAFAYYKYYYSNRKLPKVYSWISEFGPAVSTLDSTIVGISLDMYLGKDYVYYPSLEFPQYMYRNFEADFIPVNVMKSVWASHSTWEEKDGRLIDYMIENGKELYFLEKVLPDYPKENLIGFTSEELKWCESNAVEMWEFFIEKELFYSDNPRDFMKYVKAGPTSSGMPNESPGNTASWLGWQIVKSFMKNNPDYGFSDLEGITDGQKVLVKSKYKP